MKPTRILSLTALVLFAGFIWLRDTRWMQSASDTLPVLAALPLYLWLAWPVKLRAHPGLRMRWTVPCAGLAALAGVLFDCTAPMAAAWCLFLYAWLDTFAENFSRRLLLLPFLAFPWIANDAQALGWWFRFSGAGVAGELFSLLGFHVQREGTFLVVQGLPLAVDAACSGLNVLQAMWIAGFIVVYVKVPSGPRFWIALAVLGPLAWVANSIRIISLGVIALSFGADFAMGWFHQWGGWLVLCVMFGLCQWVFGLLAPPAKIAA
ncbi:MAG: archaeosortase/exosortase family protein [Verrucomicrobiota bacterium]